MLINLSNNWKTIILPETLNENKNNEQVYIAQSSFQFDESPHIIFVSDIKLLNEAVHYGDLPVVILQDEEKEIYNQVLAQYNAKPNFYNGNQLLLTAAVYDTSSNRLYLEAVRVDYVFLVSLEKMKALTIINSNLQRDFYKTGVLAPFVSKDNKVSIVTRNDNWKLRSVAAGFLECTNDSDLLTDLITDTAIKEADEEFALNTSGERTLTFVGKPTIASLSFRHTVHMLMTPTIEFIAPIQVQEDAKYLIYVMNNNTAAHAHEHVLSSAVSVPIAADERKSASEYFKNNYPGVFLYGPVLHACSTEKQKEMTFSSRMSGVTTSRFYPIRLFKPVLLKSTYLRDKKHVFEIKNNNATGVIELIRHPNHLDQDASKAILVKSFMTEYRKYLAPSDIASDLVSWDEGKQSVKAYYENYFHTELEEFTHKKFDFWVQATVDGKLAGWATFKREHANGNAVYMNLLVVHPDYQNKGIGKQLVMSLNNLDEIPALEEVNLLIRKKNQGARQFYCKLGFAVDSNYQPMDENFVDSDLLEPMRLRLTLGQDLQQLRKIKI